MLRRTLLGIAAALAACSAAAVPPEQPLLVPEKPLPDRIVGPLGKLLAAPGLAWLLLAEPKRFLAVDWLRPSLARVLHDDRIDLLARATGVDLRTVAELALASYGDGAVAYFVRHPGDALEIERLFRGRLTTGERRSVDGHQIVRVSGRIGAGTRAFVALGRDVAGYQFGGDERRGPVRVASLYEQGELRDVPSVVEDPGIAPLHALIGAMPLSSFAPGPFEGESAGGARGLLGGAVGLAAGLEPTVEQALRLVVLLAGDFDHEPSHAVQVLGAAWGDLATSDLGHLLGLDRPRAEPRLEAIAAGSILRLEIALDPSALFDGLAAATIESVQQMMRGSSPSE